MGLYAFFRLFLRPAYAVIAPLSLVALSVLYVVTLDRDFDVARRLDMSMLGLPLVLGTMVGHTAYDLRSRLFAWSLPGMQRKVATGVLVLALLASSLWTLCYHGLGGGMSVATGFSGFLLVFMCCASMMRTVPALWMVLLGIVIWSEPFFALMRTQPVACTALGLTGSAACIWSYFSPKVWRSTIHAPHMSLLVNAFNSHEVARAADAKLLRSSSARPWRVVQVGRKLSGWVRAAEHGSFGGEGRMHAAIKAYGPFALIGFMVVSPAFNDKSWAEGFEHAFHLLFEPPVTPLSATLVPVAMIQGACAWALVTQAPSMLQRGWVYPLSRAERSQLVYRLALRENLRLAIMLAVTFIMAGVLVLGFGGGSYEFDYLPRFFRGIIAIAILIPIAQIARYRIEERSAGDHAGQGMIIWIIIGTLLFGALVTLMINLWRYNTGTFSRLGQLGSLILLAIAMQGLYYRFLRSRCLKADLV